MNRRFVVLGFACLLVFGGCRRRVEINPEAEEARVVLLTEAREVTEVRAAVINALSSRGWTVEQEAGAEITARLDKKGALVRVSIQYAADRVSLKGLTAEDAGKNYRRWVANLEESIRDSFKRRAEPAPAAAAAPAAAPSATPAPTLVVFEAKQNLETLKGVLQRALNRHKWVLEGISESGEMTARLNHGKGLVRVRITSSESQATITYLESQELRMDATGRSADYERWMRNLVDSIRAETR